MVDLTNTFGYGYDRGLLDGDPWAGYVVPLATILGTADRSGRMDPAVHDAILDMDATDEVEGSNDVTDELQIMRYRTLALLNNAGQFSSQTTAEMANAAFDDPTTPTSFNDYSGFTNGIFLQDHRELASNQWAAMAALERDPHAANIFYSMDTDGNGELENLYLMRTEAGADVAAHRLGIYGDELTNEIQQTVAGSLRGGLLDYPLAMGTTYDAQTTELVTKAIEAAGWEHMDASDQVRQALAQITTPYTIDIAVASESAQTDLPPSRLAGLDQAEIDAFMQEVSESEAPGWPCPRTPPRW
jgi:hypothetical protein